MRAILLAVAILLVSGPGAGGTAVAAPPPGEPAILMAVGSYGDVAVVLSSAGLRPMAEAAVARLNDPQTFVIREEPRFGIDWFVGDKWKYARDYKNLLLVVDWRDGGELAEAVTKLLPGGDLARLRAADGGVVQLVDPFLGYQFAVLVAAGDRPSLARLLDAHAVRIRELVERQNLERIRRQFRREGLRDALTTRYWRRHRFLIDIPVAYRENQTQPGGLPAIEWVRNGPTRGISLMWAATSDPAAALRDHARLLAMRREMADRLHREDLVEEDLNWESVRLGAHDAVRLRGSWISREIAGGGAYWSYFIADPKGQRLFCLDLLAYQPSVDEPKMPLYREMLAIAETFSLEAPHP